MNTAAVLTLAEPGNMSPQGRKDIADWLRQQAAHLIKHGDNYTQNGKFRARYLYRCRSNVRTIMAKASKTKAAKAKAAKPKGKGAAKGKQK